MFIGRILRSLPFVNDLIAARGRDHLEALKEVLLNVLLSTMPIWFGAFLMMTQPTSGSYLDNLDINLRSGELYLYSTALLAPLYYFIFLEYGGGSTFPEKRLFMLIGLLIFLVATAFFTLRKSLDIFTLNLKLDEDFIFKC